ncbi:hypothetical protein QO058_01485 [Bosea vestrisii]|uniref:hypothetical protein n=1 Tax=Bosea vestrisii TaxID=151416 RepID=UPI0024DF9EA6|nr:hypothetical protein [Bosea vestrisii]WID96984.1 hypothetical protein QO058_01485 [Bosea vestrisii]
MQYQQEVLDRATGRLETKSIGEWITTTELGERYGVGPKTTRLILHHMGILAKEGVRFRLPRSLVEAGVGLRHDKPKSGYPFDVFSPHGQAVINQGWHEARADYEKECRKDDEVGDVRSALTAFKATRQEPLDTRQLTCWVLDHYPQLMLKTVATILEVTPALVTRYSKARKAQRAACQRRKERPLYWAKRMVGDRVPPRGRSCTAPVEAIKWSDSEVLPDGYITQALYTPDFSRRWVKPTDPNFTIVELLRYAPTLHRMSPAQRHHRVWILPKDENDE